MRVTVPLPGAIRLAVIVLAAVACLCLLRPTPASAGLIGKACNLAGGVAGKACDLASNPGKALKAGKDLLSGHLGSTVKDIFGGTASTASTKLAIAAVVLWVAGGAKFALDETAKVLTQTTRPNLKSTWFSGAYWRMAGIAALLTVPFLFAAAIQALMRSDISLLARAALGYLPLAMLTVGVAAPVATLLLAATDELCGLVSSAGAGGGARFLGSAGAVFGLAHFASQPFVTFLLGAITAGGALMVWLELAVREAAVYVIVLMLPLAFAALVWPARRVWAVRSVELLVALILSKFAIVAVLGLAGAALGQGPHGGLSTALAGTVLVLLAAFAPWALLRLLPLSELAAGAAATLRPELDRALHHGVRDDRSASEKPPERPDEALASNENGARDAARGQLDGLEASSGVGSGAVRGEQHSAREVTGDGSTADAAAGNGATAVPAPGLDAPTATDGRPGVLEPAEAVASPETPAAQPSRDELPEMPLGPSGFNPDGTWAGPVQDLTSGEPGEDHDPLPPGEDEDQL
jgi:hypothetical protein